MCTDMGCFQNNNLDNNSGLGEKLMCARTVDWVPGFR